MAGGDPKARSVQFVVLVVVVVVSLRSVVGLFVSWIWEGVFFSFSFLSVRSDRRKW
jgi:hypothetical protein